MHLQLMMTKETRPLAISSLGSPHAQETPLERPPPGPIGLDGHHWLCRTVFAPLSVATVLVKVVTVVTGGGVEVAVVMMGAKDTPYRETQGSVGLPWMTVCWPVFMWGSHWWSALPPRQAYLQEFIPTPLSLGKSSFNGFIKAF